MKQFSLSPSFRQKEVLFDYLAECRSFFEFIKNNKSKNLHDLIKEYKKNDKFRLNISSASFILRSFCNKKPFNDQVIRLNGKFDCLGYCFVVPFIGRINTNDPYFSTSIHKSANIILKNDKWFIQFLSEKDQKQCKPKNKKRICGVDLGIKTLVTCSDGICYNYPDVLKNSILSLDKLSSSQDQGEIKFIKKTIHDRRNKYLVYICQSILNKYDIVVIEDIDLSSYSSFLGENLVKEIGFSEFKNILIKEAKKQNKIVKIAPKYYKSSKTCCKCGKQKQFLSLKDRTFDCDFCDNVCDRDLNAAINLKNLSI